MSINLATIAANIATRFSSSVITPPSGLDNVQLSTYKLPNEITSTPTVLVKPPVGAFEYGPGHRGGELLFPVEFYVSKAGDHPANATKVYAWYGTLLEQLAADYDIGTVSEVVDATIVESRMGTLTYGEQDFIGIVFTVRVRLSAGYNAST